MDLSKFIIIMITMTIIIGYLVLFDEWCEKICDSIRYIICKKVVLQIVLTVILQ